jgi:hypothetical protein
MVREQRQQSALMKTIFDWLQHNKEWVFSGVGIAIVSAVASVFVWILKRPSSAPPSSSLQVNLAFGFLTYGPELSEQMMLFTVANPSDRPVQLTSIRVPMKNGGNMVFPHLEGEKRLPCMIEPGTSSKFWVQLADVEASIRSRDYMGSVKIRAVATDALGNDYTSNPVDVA